MEWEKKNAPEYIQGVSAAECTSDVEVPILKSAVSLFLKDSVITSSFFKHNLDLIRKGMRDQEIIFLQCAIHGKERERRAHNWCRKPEEKMFHTGRWTIFMVFDVVLDLCFVEVFCKRKWECVGRKERERDKMIGRSVLAPVS